MSLLVGNRLLALSVALLGLVGVGGNFNSQLFADQWRALLPAAGYVATLQTEPHLLQIVVAILNTSFRLLADCLI